MFFPCRFVSLNSTILDFIRFLDLIHSFISFHFISFHFISFHFISFVHSFIHSFHSFMLFVQSLIHSFIQCVFPLFLFSCVYSFHVLSSPHSVDYFILITHRRSEKATHVLTLGDSHPAALAVGEAELSMLSNRRLMGMVVGAHEIKLQGPTRPP